MTEDDAFRTPFESPFTKEEELEAIAGGVQAVALYGGIFPRDIFDWLR